MINDVHFLIHTLTQSEKRYFKLHASFMFEGEKKNYLQLFEALQKMKVYDEKLLQKQLGFKHFTQQKKQLYIKVLESLRNFHHGKNSSSLIDSAISEYRILLDKSMIKAAAKALKRAEALAQSHENFTDIIRIKQLETDLFVAAGNPQKIEEHIREIRILMPEILLVLDNKIAFEKEYLLFVKLNQQTEFIRSEQEAQLLKSSFDHELLQDEKNALSVSTRLMYYYIKALYYFLSGDLNSSLTYFELQHKSFENHPGFAREQSLEFAKSIANIILLSIKTKNYLQAELFYSKLEKLRKNPSLTQEQIHFWLYILTLSSLVGQKQFKKAYDWITAEEKEENRKFNWMNETSDRSFTKEKNYLLFDASLSCMMQGNLKKARTIISSYLNSSKANLKDDAYTLARIVQLFIYLEREEFTLIDYEIRSLKRYLLEYKRLFAFEKCCITFIETQATLTTKKEKLESWNNFQNDLEYLKQDPFEKNVFLSFDLSIWVEEKVRSLKVRN